MQIAQSLVSILPTSVVAESNRKRFCQFCDSL